MKYSIIVPIYNSEKTLSRCLDSILEQNYPNAELLLINDGSSDQSEEICREYAGKYPNILCRTTENHGVSAARNLGLELARGTYILFVDSDDYVSPDYFREIDRTLAQGDPELVIFAHRLFGRNTYEVPVENRIVRGRDEVLGVVARYLRMGELNTLWSKVFRRDLIEANHLRFNEALCIDEDMNFVFSYSLHVSRLNMIDGVLYNTSLENEESLTRKRRDYLCQQLHDAGLRRSAMLQQAKPEGKNARNLSSAVSWVYYRSAYSSAAELLKYDLTRKQRRAKVREICHVFSDCPDKLTTPLIAIPIRMRFITLIDLSARIAVHRRRN